MRRELLQDAMAYYEAFIAEAGNDPSVQADLAATYFRIGILQQVLGDSAQATESYRRARLLYEQGGDEASAELARCENGLGSTLARQGQIDAAEAAFRRAIKLCEDNLPSDPAVESEQARAYNRLAQLLGTIERRGEARPLFQRAATMQRRLVEQTPDDASHRQDLASTLCNLGFLLTHENLAAAEDVYVEAVQIQQRLVERFPRPLVYRRDLALTWNNLGAVQNRRGQFEDAEASYRKAIVLRRELSDRAPQVVAYRRDLAVTLNNLGFLQLRHGQLTAAEASIQDALDAFGTLVREHPQQVDLSSGLGGVYNNLGILHERRNEREAAAAAYRQAAKWQRQSHQAAPQVARYRQFLSKHHGNLARVLRELKRYNEAAEETRQRKRLWPNEPQELYRAAREYALTADGLTGPTRQKLVDEAAKTLHEAVSAGLKDLSPVRSGDKWQSVRAIPDIQALLDGNHVTGIDVGQPASEQP